MGQSVLQNAVSHEVEPNIAQPVRGGRNLGRAGVRARVRRPAARAGARARGLHRRAGGAGAHAGGDDVGAGVGGAARPRYHRHPRRGFDAGARLNSSRRAASTRSSISLDARGSRRQGRSRRASGRRRRRRPAATALARLFASAPRDGRSVVSAPLPRADDRRERLRFFLRRDARGAVALLADTDRFFDGIRQAAFESSVAPMRWIVMDDALPLGRPRRRRARRRLAGRTSDDGGRAAALAAMAHGRARHAVPAATVGRGARARAARRGRRLRAGAAAHRRLVGGGRGLGASACAIARGSPRGDWRPRPGVTALIVGLFGVAITRQQRRAQALADALRLAEATAALRERSEKLVESVPLGVLALDARRARHRRQSVPRRARRARRRVADRGAARPVADERAPLDALLVEARATRRSQARQGAGAHARRQDARGRRLRHPAGAAAARRRLLPGAARSHRHAPARAQPGARREAGHHRHARRPASRTRSARRSASSRAAPSSS